MSELRIQTFGQLLASGMEVKAECSKCRHVARMDAYEFRGKVATDASLDAIGRKLRCTICGAPSPIVGAIKPKLSEGAANAEEPAKRTGRYSGQIREVINRNSLVSLALARGYNAFLPVYDGGIDFILFNEESGDTKLVQLKGRWTIDKKYFGRNVWIAFHDDGRWYLAPHDELIRHADNYGYTKSKSWIEGGAYTCPALTKAQLTDLAPYAFEPLVSVTEAAASEPS